MTAVRMFIIKPENSITVMPDITFILAHGAGAPADSGFMEKLSKAMASEGITTVRFEFPYMEQRREDGRKRPPDRQPVLLSRFREVIQRVSREQGGSIFIGGKSMGGRMASLLAAEPDLKETLAGCLCFGYPFHPPGKAERWRVEHFDQFRCPVLIVQGTRDPFGKEQEVRHRQALSDWGFGIHWLDGGDHDFKPLARQPETQEGLIDTAAKAAAAFMINHC
jgi:predicted alpha/beta-hydrolase family hydrolase